MSAGMCANVCAQACVCVGARGCVGVILCAVCVRVEGGCLKFNLRVLSMCVYAEVGLSTA